MEFRAWSNWRPHTPISNLYLSLSAPLWYMKSSTQKQKQSCAAHCSSRRLSTGSLSPISLEELAASGIKASDFGPANWKAAQGTDGKQYGVPLDIHSIILYYNKDLLKKAGLLGDDGKPKGLDGVANWDAALAKLTDQGCRGAFRAGRQRVRLAHLLHALEPAGRRVPQGRQIPRRRQSEKATTAMAEMKKWVKNGWTPAKTEYPASIALFTAGKAAMHINGVWEVPTMVDLAKKGQLFDWGAIQIPVLYDHPATWADSHSFAIPDRKGNPVDPAKRKLVLDTDPLVQRALAGMGGRRPRPRLLPVQESAEYKALKPNSDYSSLAKTAVFDPVSTLAGVASPVYDAAGNYIVPAMSGEMSPADAAKQMRDDLQNQAK